MVQPHYPQPNAIWATSTWDFGTLIWDPHIFTYRFRVGFFLTQINWTLKAKIPCNPKKIEVGKFQSYNSDTMEFVSAIFGGLHKKISYPYCGWTNHPTSVGNEW
jgi:hypothetical protein